ncbi:MAG TPA: hypothetical protein VFH92_03700 [Phenylobacterium sp.]|nr:hypothetical protein [Phenylobacterium sp.]
MEIVNGYVCKTCTDVANAKKGVDPAHPKDGPNGVDAKDEARKPDAKGGHGPAVTFGGVLAQSRVQSAGAVSPIAPAPSPLATPGATVNIRA